MTLSERMLHRENCASNKDAEWECDCGKDEVAKLEQEYERCQVEYARQTRKKLELEQQVEALEEALNQKEHFIVFSETGWSIEHLIECRPDMTTCPIHKAAEEQITDQFPLGRFPVSLVDGILEVRVLRDG